MRLFLAFLATALMAAAAAAAGTYRWQQQERIVIVEEQRAGLEAEIEDLNVEIDRLERQLVALGGTGALESAIADVLPCEINDDPASTSIKYTHERSDTVFDVPYNPVWGLGEPAPDPYILLSGIDGVLFGRPRSVGDCDWIHTLQFTAIPARTAEEIAADVGERMGVPIERSIPDVLLTEEVAGENTFYSYRLAGNCMLQNYELIGDDLNVIFSTCVENTEDLKEVLPSVRRL